MPYLYQEFLAHHGVKGQKWGVRRFQNDDGTLTEAGKARYAGQKEYNDNTFLRKTLGSDFGQYSAHYHAQKRQERKIAKAERKGDEKAAAKWRSKNEAYRAAEANQQAYRRHTSTAKLIAQNVLLTPIGGIAYRHARARGDSRVQAALETSLSRILKDRQAYGHYTLHSGMRGEPL